MELNSSRRLRLRLEFEGTDYCGWQLQSEGPGYEGKPSLQAVMERAVATAFRRSKERFPVKGCGRTDAGVHAEEFYCHLDLPEEINWNTTEDLERFRHSLSCLLPDSIAVTDIERVRADFHAIDHVESKTYEYRLWVRRSKPTLLRNKVYWLPLAPADFSEELFLKALKYFEGRHDFVAFAAKNSNAKTTEREILRVELVGEDLGQGTGAGRLLRVRFTGRGFLKQMVRNMVGTALEVPLQKRNLESIERLLGRGEDGRAGKRQEAGLCMPGCGLFLLKVNYRGEDKEKAKTR